MQSPLWTAPAVTSSHLNATESRWITGFSRRAIFLLIHLLRRPQAENTRIIRGSKSGRVGKRSAARYQEYGSRKNNEGAG
jgi:hypothetical protein